MDHRTGEITDRESLMQKMADDFIRHASEIDESKLSPKRQAEFKQFGRTKIGRNEKCPCGSGKKFKVCCRMRVVV